MDNYYNVNIINPIKQNDYNFTGSSIFYVKDANLTSINSFRKGYLLENLYSMCLNKSDSEIIVILDDIITKTYTLNQQKIPELLKNMNLSEVIINYILTKRNARFNSFLYSYHLKFTSKYNENSNFYSILNTHQHEDFIPIMLADIVKINFTNYLINNIALLSHAFSYTSNFEEQFNINEDNTVHWNTFLPMKQNGNPYLRT